MHGSLKSPIKLVFLSTALLSSGCIAPLIIGGGAAAGMVATSEKGIGGTVSDSNIRAKVKMNLYNFNADLHAKVSVTVQNQEVYLTGVVSNPQWPADAERLAKNVEGVKNVVNDIETEGEESLGSITNDGWITTRIRSSMLFEKDIYSLNYTIDTVNGVVYVTGIGQSEEEINRITEIARNVGGVKKVVNHVKVKQPENAPDSGDATSQPQSNESVVAQEDASQPVAGESA